MTGMAAFEHVERKKALDALKGEILAQGYRAGCTSHEKIGDRLGRSGGTIANWIRDPESIKLGDLRKMVKLLRLDARVVLAALGYTGADLKKLKNGGEASNERW